MHGPDESVAVGLEGMRPSLLLRRFHAVGQIFRALPRRVLALFELRRLLLQAILFFLPLLELVIRFLCHVIVMLEDVEQLKSQYCAAIKIAVVRLAYNAALK